MNELDRSARAPIYESPFALQVTKTTNLIETSNKARGSSAVPVPLSWAASGELPIPFNKGKGMLPLPLPLLAVWVKSY